MTRKIVQFYESKHDLCVESFEKIKNRWNRVKSLKLDEIAQDRDFELVCLRGGVHVSCNFMQQAIWLIINVCYCLLGPTCCCVWNAWKGEAATSCFLRGQNLIHATVQWTVEHASTVHWTVFFYKKKQWRHASTVRWIGFFFLNQCS